VQFGTKANCLDFEVRSQGYRPNNQLSTLRGIFSPVCNQVHVTLMTFSRSWIQRSRSRQ